MVDTRYCTTHERHHVVGSVPYKTCFGEESLGKKTTEESVDEKKETSIEEVVERTIEKVLKKPVEETKKVEKSPVTLSSEIYISSFSKESVLKCVLKSDSPDFVTVRGNFYATGVRTFHRNDEPFMVTLGEFNSVLDRGERLFKLIT